MAPRNWHSSLLGTPSALWMAAAWIRW